jgi:hypothetical protein
MYKYCGRDQSQYADHETQVSSLENLARQRATGLAMAFQRDQGGPAAAARSADPEPACQAPQAMLR